MAGAKGGASWDARGAEVGRARVRRATEQSSAELSMGEEGVVATLGEPRSHNLLGSDERLKERREKGFPESCL